MNSNKYGNLKGIEQKEGLVTKSYSINFNSALATPLDPDGFNNKYKVVLNNGIGVPKNAKSCRVYVAQASVWNFDANVRAPVNKIYFKPNAIDPETSIEIPDGYYGLTELNSQIRLQLQLGGHPTDIFSFSGDTATQQIVINFGLDGVYLNFTPDDSIYEILGMNQRYSPITAPATPASAGDIDLGNSVAQFNSVNSFTVVCGSIVNEGVPINAIGTSILGIIPVTSPPNSIITYSPEQAIKIECDHLIGSNQTDIVWELRNELLQDVQVLDPFNFTITVEWEE